MMAAFSRGERRRFIYRPDFLERDEQDVEEDEEGEEDGADERRSGRTTKPLASCVPTCTRFNGTPLEKPQRQPDANPMAEATPPRRRPGSTDE